MGQLQLVSGQTYNLKVTEFKSKNKQIPKADGFRYDLYWVTIEDKNGNSIKCEYAAREGTCKDCFQLGVYQYIKCGFISKLGTPEIEPTDEPIIAKSLGGEVTNPLDDNKANVYSAAVSGRSYTFAVAYAKDLLAAEVAQQPFGHKITDEDIDRMFGWADQINNKMVERMSF